MPTYNTSNNPNVASWYVPDELYNYSFGTEKWDAVTPEFKCVLENPDRNAIQQIYFRGLRDRKNEVGIIFCNEEERKKFKEILTVRFGYKIVPVMDKENYIKFAFFVSEPRGHLINIFAAINMVSPLPLPMLEYLFKFFGIPSYGEAFNQIVLSHLAASYKDEMFDEKHFDQALMLARASADPANYMTIAQYYAPIINLEICALKAALLGLAFIHQPTIAVYAKPELSEALYYQAGAAVRACSFDTLKRLSQPAGEEKSKAERVATAIVSGAASSKLVTSQALPPSPAPSPAPAAARGARSDLDIKEISEMLRVSDRASGHLGHGSLDDAEHEVDGLESLAESPGWVLNVPVDLGGFKIRTKEDQFCLAMKYFSQIKNPKLVYFAKASEACTAMFATAAELGVDRKKWIHVLVGDRVPETLLKVAARIKELQNKISELKSLLKAEAQHGKPSADEILADHRKQISDLEKTLENCKAELKANTESISSTGAQHNAIVHSLNAKITELTQANVKLQEKMKELDKTLSDTLSKQENVQETHETEGQELKGKVEGLEQQNTALKAQLTTTNTEHKAQTETLMAEIRNLQAELAEERRQHSLTKLDLKFRSVQGSPAALVGSHSQSLTTTPVPASAVSASSGVSGAILQFSKASGGAAPGGAASGEAGMVPVLVAPALMASGSISTGAANSSDPAGSSLAAAASSPGPAPAPARVAS